MNLSSNGPPPPINNACLPDIYNRLDAEVIERTRVLNAQLAVRLSSQEKIISKYKLAAERYIVMERSRANDELSRIRHILPTVSRVSNFDDTFFRKQPKKAEKKRRRAKTKTYQAKTNDDAICHRCYIHHLPTKKRFYKVESPPPPISVLETVGNNPPPAAGESPTPMVHSAPPPSTNPPIMSDLALEFDSLYSPSPTTSKRGQGSRLIPPSKKYQFLEWDRCGHEKDLNDTLTPRLMPNEMWKDVVKNVCKQTVNTKNTLPKMNRIQRGTGLIREKPINEATFETKSRRTSSRLSGKGRRESRPSSRSVGMKTGGVSRANSTMGRERTSLSRMSRSKSRSGQTNHSREGSAVSVDSVRADRPRMTSPSKSFVASKSKSLLVSHKE